MFGLKCGELGVALEPCFPSGRERSGLALASEHAMEVGTADSEIRSGQRGTGEADQSAFGLVRGGSHFTCCVLFGGDVGFPLRCAFRMLATRKDLANAINEARYFYRL